MAPFNINRLPVFTQEVFYFTLPNFEEWQKQIKQIILVEENKNIHKHDTSPKESCNVMAKRTAWNSHERYESLNLLCLEIDKYLSFFIKQEGYDMPKLKVHDCWINWYTKNNFSQPHRHGSHLSVVVFLDVEDTDAKFFFHSNENMVLIKKNETNTNFTNLKEVNVKNGTVIFFDGSLYHSVSPNTTDKKRITVAMNYDVIYQNLREDY
jgi:uncharacterized protein (TIGR02466 family)